VAQRKYSSKVVLVVVIRFVLLPYASSEEGSLGCWSQLKHDETFLIG